MKDRQPIINLRNTAAWAFKQLRDPKSCWQTAVLVIVVAFAYLYRAKQYFFNPQLFAEDGVLWLAEGHDKDIFALLQPVNGFLHFPERLFGYVVAHLPLHFAPELFVLTAWVLFILLAYYLLSSRTKILTNNFERISMVAALCLVANLDEFFFNFSNSIFLIGIIGTLIILAKTPRNRIVKFCERILFLLSCFTLPFAWFYLPVALVERFKYKHKDSFFLYSALLASLVQAAYYLTSHVDRSPITLLSLFSKYTLLEIYNQLVIPAIRFTRIDIPVAEFSDHHFPVLFAWLTIIALLAAAFVVIKKSNRQVLYLLFFLAAMTFASIKSPTINVATPVDALKHMAIVTGGSRYFVYGILAVNIIFIKAAYDVLVPRARYVFMAVFFGFGLLTSIHYQSFYIEKNFVDYSAQYNAGIDLFESGTTKQVVIPVNPTPWHLTLTHK